MHLLDEVAKHSFGRVKVSDDTVLERADGHDVARGATDHLLGLGPHRQDATRILIDGDDGRLVENDPAAANIDEGVGRAEIDGHIATDERHRVRHSPSP